jgi:tetratricopeptide (TPR) repeat protein
MPKWNVDYSKFESIEDPDPPTQGINYLEPDEALNKSYEAEMVSERPEDKLKEMKIKLAMDAYERRRPKDIAMHHYVIKDAGDLDAIGEYFQTGDERNGCPIYMNSSGITLSREKQPKGDSDEEQYGWILGSIDERRPLYGVMTDDLSVPTLGWQGFTAPEPVPTIRYYSNSNAARMFKDKGNSALQSKLYAEAESWYTKALSTNMDPHEFSEPMAIVYSNRSQVRLLMLKYSAAAHDADMALRFLQSAQSLDEPSRVLQQKTYLRRAKALGGMKLFFEAENVMREARQKFPECQEIEKAFKDMQVAKMSDTKESPQAGPSGKLLQFMGTTVQEMQAEVSSATSSLADAVFPMPLTKALLKMEYIFSKADGEVLVDLQSLFRTNGGLRTLLHLVQVQWKSNLEGKAIDMYKLDSLCTVLSVMSMACDSQGIHMVASEAPALFAALGGCNRKVNAAFCTTLLSLVSKVWNMCKSVSLDALQPCSAVVERAAAFLSKLVLTEEPLTGPDAPVVSATDKVKASELLREWFVAGGRLEKRTVRGAVPMLASFDGTGFLTAEDKSVRDLGESFLQKVQGDPSMLSARDVSNLLYGAQLLIMYGPGSGRDVTAVKMEGAEAVGSTMHYVDLEKWSSTEDGRYAASMLGAVARSLEERLLGSRELGKEEYKEAFVNGHGWSVCIPLVQGPTVFSVPAMKCMGAMSSVPPFVAPAIAAILGFPSPESKPMISYIGKGLAADAKVRMCAAKLLSKCVQGEAFLSLMRKDGEKCMKELVKLIMNASLDGKSSLEALHDMLYLFYHMAQTVPDPLCKHTTEDMMTMLVGISRNPIEDAPQFYAKGILSILALNRKCDKVIKVIESRYEAGVGVDPEDILKADL